jgi:hypothetical protein
MPRQQYRTVLFRVSYLCLRGTCTNLAYHRSTQGCLPVPRLTEPGGIIKICIFIILRTSYLRIQREGIPVGRNRYQNIILCRFSSAGDRREKSSRKAHTRKKETVTELLRNVLFQSITLSGTLSQYRYIYQ